MKGKIRISDGGRTDQPGDTLHAEIEALITDSDGIEHRNEGIAVIDQQGVVIYANEAFAQLHGFNRSDPTGKKLDDLVRADLQDYTNKVLGERSSEKIRITPFPYESSENPHVNLLISAIPVKPGHAYADHTILIARVVPEDDVVAEAAGMKKTQLGKLDFGSPEQFKVAYLEAIDEALGAVVFISPEGIIRRANRTASILFGYKPDELRGQNFITLLPPDLRAKIEEFLRSPEKVRWVGEFVRVRPNGKERHVKLSLTHVSGKGAGEDLLIASAKDVTELRLMELHLRQAQKLEAIGLLASGLAHNINSPLSAIVMTAEIAQTKYPEVGEFDDILQATGRINEIINNLMTKSRQEQTDTEMSIDINQLVKTELKFLEANLFFKHSVERDIQLAEGLPTIQGLYSDFSQCFQNLISNAMDAMAQLENCTLNVRTSHDEVNGRIILSIRDSGSGIEREDLEKIFEPFFTTKAHLHETEPGRPSGTGLGLSAARQLLARYGADITVESEPGKGSEFTVSIPVKSLSDVPDSE